MERKKTDRRVKLTRNLLKNALVQLMQEQHISKISVRALCDAASINRSTFYVHYNDQYDLLSKIEQEVLDNLNKYLEKQDLNHSNPISAQVLTSILDYFKENIELFRALLSENCGNAFQKDILALAQVISSQIDQSLDPKTQEYINAFCLTGAISMLHKWIKDGTDESSAQMSQFNIQVLYYGITSIKSDVFS